jgi:hypothetical protein
MVMIRSSAGWPASQACREPSWCSIMARIGRRGRLRRCAPRLGAGGTAWVEPGGGVADLVAVPLLQLLVDMLDREA